MKQEWLSDRVFVYTDGAVTFGQDALALARFCNPTPADVAVDLGTGCAILPLLWAAENTLPRQTLAVDRLAPAVALATRAVEENHLADRIRVVDSDWNTLPATLDGTATLLSCNPPYFKQHGGKISPDPARAAARTEEDDTALPRLMQTAARLLSKNGRFCFCMRPERQEDVKTALANASLFIETKTALVHESGEEWLTLFCAKRRNDG